MVGSDLFDWTGQGLGQGLGFVSALSLFGGLSASHKSGCESRFLTKAVDVFPKQGLWINRSFFSSRPSTCELQRDPNLNEFGTDVKVQQELLRHADIRTTINIYTRAVPERLWEANSKVVRLLLPTGT